MKVFIKGRVSRAGLSLLELVALVAVIGLMALIFVSYLEQQRRPYGAPRIKCVNNLKNVGLAFQIFATDNNDQFPPAVMLSNGVKFASIDALSVYRNLSNELSTPLILHCPVDQKRRRPDNLSFTNISSRNISYFASLMASGSTPLAVLAGDRNLHTNGKAAGPGIAGITTNMAISWSKEMHNEQGNIAMGDGSVQQMSTNRLKQSVADQGIETNYLAIP